MKYLLLCLLLVGCTTTPSRQTIVVEIVEKNAKDDLVTAPYEPIYSPSEKCHFILDAMCEQSARCTQGEPDHVYHQCMAFMAGFISLNGNAVNARGACDQVEGITDNYDECLEGILTTCEVPLICDTVAAVEPEPEVSL